MRKKPFILFIAGLVLLAISISAIMDHSIWGWVGAVLFGSSTIWALTQIINPKNKWHWKIDTERQTYTKADFDRIYNDHGIFSFTGNGFTVETQEGIIEIQWAEIKSMLAYKEDLLTTDSICLDIFCDNDKNFKIREETRGWYMFVANSKKAFPAIDPSWEMEIMTPAFETKLTVIYDRNGRVLKELETEYYRS